MTQHFDQELVPTGVSDEVLALSEAEPRWIRSEQQLASFVDECLQRDFVALDTEFERTSTYFANPGLIQIATASDVVLVDPLEVCDLKPLAPLLESHAVVKVLHSMSEDVELLRHACGVTPVNLFDTQVAADFLGLGASLGYQKLVHEVLDVMLDKSETRSDWLQRPLSNSQIAYAVKDTAYLIELYRKLSAALESRSLLELCLAECAHLVQQVEAGWNEPRQAYLKLRGGWSLSPEKQMLLQDLVIWRDELAISQNIPKSWVFGDPLLLEVAESRPVSPKQLYALKGVKGRSVKQFGQALVDRIADFEIMSDAPDFVRIDAPLRGAELEIYKRFKRIIAQVAQANGLPVQRLASRKHIEQAVAALFRKQTGVLPDFFQGWRKQYLEAPLLNAIDDACSR